MQEMDQMKRYNSTKEEEMQARHTLEKRRLPKILKAEAKTRALMFKQSLRLSTFGTPDDDKVKIKQVCCSVVVWSFYSRWHCSTPTKGLYTVHQGSPPVSPLCCPQNSASVCLVGLGSFVCLLEVRSFLTSEVMSAISFLQSSVISAVMLWPVHIQTGPQASKYLCSAKLWTRCDVCCACQSVILPLTWACPGQQIHRRLSSGRLCMAECQSGQPIPYSTFCSRSIESVRMMACIICVSHWEASHCVECVAASTSVVRLEIMTVGTTVFMHSPSILFDCEPPTTLDPSDCLPCRSQCHVACFWLPLTWNKERQGQEK